MKKLSLFIIVCMSVVSCSTGIKQEAFIEDLNSFDSTATYYHLANNAVSVEFIIKQNDSLFYYEVEKTDFTRNIYTTKNIGDKVK